MSPWPPSCVPCRQPNSVASHPSEGPLSLGIVLSKSMLRRARARSVWGSFWERPAPDPRVSSHEPMSIPPMNAVAELLSPDDILLDLDVASKKRVFEEVGRLLEQRHGLAQTKVVESLSAREKLGSTGLGQGVAVPHARVKGLHQALAAFVRSRFPIPFDAPDAKPVSEMSSSLCPSTRTSSTCRSLPRSHNSSSTEPSGSDSGCASMRVPYTSCSPTGRDLDVARRVGRATD